MQSYAGATLCTHARRRCIMFWALLVWLDRSGCSVQPVMQAGGAVQDDTLSCKPRSCCVALHPHALAAAATITLQLEHACISLITTNICQLELA
jgi:hypothetical protein